MRIPKRSRIPVLTVFSAVFAVVWAATIASPALARLDPEELCEREKVRQIGEFGRCRMDAAQRARATGKTPNYEACDAAFAAHAQRDCATAAESGITEAATSAAR